MLMAKSKMKSTRKSSSKLFGEVKVKKAYLKKLEEKKFKDNSFKR